MRVTIIGSGYVGLVSGACFADYGHHVVCVDTDAAKIEMLRQGRIPIYEPGLAELVALNVRERRLAFATDLAGPVRIYVADRHVSGVDEAEPDHRPDSPRMEAASQAATDETDVQSHGQRRC